MVQRKSPSTSSSHPSNIHKQNSITMAEAQKLRTHSRNNSKLELTHQLSTEEKPYSSTSVKRSVRQLPNYMKSTTSSAARKEQVQVNSLAKLNCSKTTPPSRNSAASGSKPAQNLKRKYSFRVAKIPSIIRSNSLSSASSKMFVNRHTCSSTMKDAKFPKALELSPGATEAEGTSAMKVCPYKYCSLNGHRHNCLPPLKCFLASKRKLMEAQKRMKIKGVSPFRKPVPGKDKEIDTGQPVARTRSNVEIISLIEEVCDDFFVEIYCQPQEEIVAKPVSTDEEEGASDAAIISEKNSEGDEQKEEDVIHEADGDGNLSLEDFEGTIDFLDHMSCDTEKEKLESLAAEETEKVEGYSNEEIIEDSEGFAEDFTSNRMAIIEVCEVDLEDLDSNSVCSTEFSDASSMFGNIFESDDICKDVDLDAIFIAEKSSSTPTEENVSEQDDFMTDFSQNENIEFIQAIDNQKQVEMEEDELRSADKSISDEFVEENQGQTTEEDVEVIDFEAANVNQNKINESELLTSQELPDEADEVENGQQIQQEKKVRRPEVKSSEESGLDDYNLKLCITRNKIDEEMSEMNDINFRGPDFLPEEPDPESEKVDLRHQTVDERKNAEEWMIDYALQKAVSKLASARRRKVSLLVEAFETVKPLPLCEKPLQNVNQAYANAPPLQACN